MNKKHILVIFILTGIIFLSCNNNDKIPSYFNGLDHMIIWNELYPNSNNFDEELRLIRKERKDGDRYIYRTKISDIFYYMQGDQRMATVILLTYDYSNGFKSDCHACYPQVDIANFILTDSIWTKQSVKYDFGIGGSYGEAASIEFSIIDNENALVILHSNFSFGCTYSTTSYYNIQTLEKIKPSKEEKICEEG